MHSPFEGSPVDPSQLNSESEMCQPIIDDMVEALEAWKHNFSIEDHVRRLPVQCVSEAKELSSAASMQCRMFILET